MFMHNSVTGQINYIHCRAAAAAADADDDDDDDYGVLIGITLNLVTTIKPLSDNVCTTNFVCFRQCCIRLNRKSLVIGLYIR